MNQTIALKILKTGDNVFITGSAGTGKTHLLNNYIQYLKERKINPTIVAPTGIAASHLMGQTIHSFFALGIRDEIDDVFIGSLLQQKYLMTRFAKLQVLIVDEVSMISPKIFSAMDSILKAFKESSKPFGGVQVILSGDFFQLPPVTQRRGEKRFAWQSPSWKDLSLKTCYLEEKFRQDDNQLISVLDEIRSGYISNRSHEILQKRFHKELDISFVPTKLYTHNIDVERINQQELNKLITIEKRFTYTGVGSQKNIERIFKTSLVLEEVSLKVGAVVIFIKNNHDLGYVNGTTGVIDSFDDSGQPIVNLATGSKIRVKHEDWSLENDKGEVMATVSQVPLRLAWAITIHKSQGMTLDAAEIDLSKTFEAGQGYVALSRIRNIEGLRLMGVNDMALKVDSLILSIDDRIKMSSARAKEEVEALNKHDHKELCKKYMLKLGGLLDINEIEEEKKVLAHEKTLKEVVPNNIKTKHLLESSDSIEALAKKRGLTVGTIINHLTILKEDDSSLNLDKFKPAQDVVEKINKKVLEIKANKREKDFSESGQMRLKSIFEAFNGEISYEEIRVALLFVNG